MPAVIAIKIQLELFSAPIDCQSGLMLEILVVEFKKTSMAFCQDLRK